MENSESNTDNGKRLIDFLVSALNGDDYEEAHRIKEEIIATGDQELIDIANYLFKVV